MSADPGQHPMSAADFSAWLDEMIRSGRASSKASCGRILGVSDNFVFRAERAGIGQTGRRTALACAAVLAGIEPYTGDDERIC